MVSIMMLNDIVRKICVFGFDVIELLFVVILLMFVWYFEVYSGYDYSGCFGEYDYGYDYYYVYYYDYSDCGGYDYG